jgi:hypothetical protein
MRSPFLPARSRAVQRALGCLGALALAAAAACSEDLDSGAGCGVNLCPVTNAEVRDTVLDAVALDTALANVPVAGDLPTHLLAVRPGPDSLDVRAVFRFDTLPARYAPSGGGDSVAVTTVRSSALQLRLDTTVAAFGPARARLPRVPVTLEAYEADTVAAVDTLPAALTALFRPARLLGRVTLPAAAALPDSVRIPIDPDAYAARSGGRLRVGVRVVSTETAELRVYTPRASGRFGALAPQIRFVPATDTATRQLTAVLASATPAEPTLAAVYASQNFVARSPSAPAGTDLVVGGMPARRSLLRFDVPSRFVDSVSLVRATLELTQRPAPGGDPLDSVLVRPVAVLATGLVTDLTRASEIAASNGIPTARLSPAGSGLRELPVVQLIVGWRLLPAGTQRALVLRADAEGTQAGEIRFYSIEAPAGLRPRLRLSYVPRTTFGLP